MDAEKLRRQMELITGLRQQEPVQIPMAPMEEIPAVDPEVIEEVKTEAAQESINEEATSPYMKTKEELVDQRQENEAEETVQGQLQKRMPASEEDMIKEVEDKFDPRQSMVENIRRLESEINGQKKGPTSDEKVMDWLTGIGKAANVLNRARGINTPDVQLTSEARAKRNEKDKAVKLNQLQQLQKAYQDYLKSEGTEGMSEKDKAYLDYYNKSLDIKKERLDRQDDRQDKSLKDKDIDRKIKADDKIYKVTEDFEKNPIVKELNKQGIAFEQADQLVEEIKKGSQVALGALGTKMAKAMGEVGVLTDADVKRYIQAQSIIRKAKDKFGTAWSGKVSQDTIKDIENLNRKMKDGFSRKREKLYERYVTKAYKNYGKSAGLSKEEVDSRFGFVNRGSEKNKEYTTSQETGIERVMKNNNISREKAIKALKNAGKL